MLVGLATAGNVLLYMPCTSKSMKITYMPVAEAMAERGHQVTVVMPWEHKGQHKNIRVSRNCKERSIPLSKLKRLSFRISNSTKIS